jgi:hypothetical protein
MYPGCLLAQEVCSYQATTQLLMGVRGDFTVIVHSDRDCSNVLPKTGGEIRSEHPYKYFCTNMREDELVTGQGNAKLRRAIELVHQAYHPKLIIVLATCPTVMIGDNIKNVARKAGKDLGTNVVAETTNGLRPKSPAEIVDDTYWLLAKSAPAAVGDVSKRINLVGIGLTPPERTEVEGVLAAMGLHLNAVLNEDASLDDFLAVSNARFNVHPGPNLMVSFDESCAKKFGQTAIEVPLPFGVSATDRFYRAIGRAAGVADEAIEQAIGSLRTTATAVVDEARTRIQRDTRAAKNRPPRCAYNVGSIQSFDLRRIAHEELGELPFFDDLGFETKIYIQGPQDDANRQRTGGVLAELGIKTPWAIFPDPGGLAKHLRPGDFDLFYGMDFLADQLSKLNLPLFEKSRAGLGLGYGATTRNVELLSDVLASKFYRHFKPDAGHKLPVASSAHV